MFGEGIIGHVLGDQQPLVAVAAVSNQIGKPFVSQLPNSPSFIGELFGVRPGQFGKFLDGDPPTVIIVLVLEAALVDDIGGLLAALGDDEVGAEIVGGGFQVGQRELRESRHVSGRG